LLFATHQEAEEFAIDAISQRIKRREEEIKELRTAGSLFVFGDRLRELSGLMA
jgi:hypothetical protein